MRKCMGFLGSLIIVAGMISPAQADTWSWSYSGTDIFASGLMSTAGNASSFEAILSISGARNGSNISGLNSGDPSWISDNLFRTAPPEFSNGGLLFNTDDGHIVNLYSVGTTMYDSVLPDGGFPTNYNPGNVVQFSVTAVPEPESYAMMLAGLGLMVFIARRRKLNAAA